MMLDREKVIEALENAYAENGTIKMSVEFRDAILLPLLKEQEAVEPDTDSEGTCTCGNCGENVGYYPVDCNTPQRLCKFCPECGKAVKWE